MNVFKKIDLSNRKLNKRYDFRTIENLDDFTTQYIWPRDIIINNEKQWYVDPASGLRNPFILNNKGLSIEASITPDGDLAEAENQPFLSGVLTTRDRGYSQLFGYWEMSAKLPKAGGAWPAFWLLPTFEQWPTGIKVLSEIDIMEAVSDVTEGIYHGTSHSNETGELVSSKDNKIITQSKLTEHYYRYGLSWDTDWLIWYFEGIEVKRTKTPADMQDEPRHFLLNFAVGGWGGTVTVTDYPATFDIDYVVIYSEEENKVPSPPPPAPGNNGGFVIPGTPGYSDEAVYILKDGRLVTKTDINLVTEYLIQSTSKL